MAFPDAPALADDVRRTAAAADARYREAVRHSGRVRFLRRAIPVGAVLAVVAIAFLAIVEPFRTLPSGLTVGPLSVSGTKVTMEMPRLSGFKKDNRPYEVTARWASQDVKHPSVIELKDIKARIALQERGFATVDALSGVYDTNAETIRLTEDVRVRTDTGYDAKLRSAVVDFKAGAMRSDEPVTVNFGGGTIDALSVDMLDNGTRVLFEGKVRTVMIMDPGAPRAAASKGTAP